jgi:hypothetical protein
VAGQPSAINEAIDPLTNCIFVPHFGQGFSAGSFDILETSQGASIEPNVSAQLRPPGRLENTPTQDEPVLELAVGAQIARFDLRAVLPPVHDLDRDRTVTIGAVERERDRLRHRVAV